MILSALNGHKDISSLLIKQGKCNINATHAANRTALMTAAHEGRQDIVSLLLANSSCDAKLKDKSGITALMDACMKGRSEIVSLLLPISNINDQDKKGMTALMHCCRHGHTRVVSILLSTNCNVDICDNEGDIHIHTLTHSLTYFLLRRSCCSWLC